MRNTGLNKTKFIALYWGQNVGMVFDHDWEKHMLYQVGTGATVSEVDYLELKPLSAISEEHLIKCYRLHSAFIGYDHTMDFKPVLEMANHWFANGGLENILKCPDTVDYLRSKGYSLPWCGLSEGDLVSRGWVVLKV